MTVIEFLVYRIISGVLEFKNIPKPLKADVKTMLEEMGVGYLADFGDITPEEFKEITGEDF